MGMGQIDTFRDVIKLWTTLDGMALDIGAKPSAISKWRKRDSIPAEWWVAILSTEPAAKVGLTAETLTSLAAREAAEARV